MLLFPCVDIIFCIYLYQRWIYRVDPKRVNEFGTSGEMMSQPASEQLAVENSNGSADGDLAPGHSDQNGSAIAGNSTTPSPSAASHKNHRQKSKSSKKKD